MATTVNMHEAKTHLSRLVERAAEGEVIVIARAGAPVAELRAYQGVDVVFGALRDVIHYEDAFSDEAEADVRSLFDSDLELSQEGGRHDAG